jgi:hypothetical protein
MLASSSPECIVGNHVLLRLCVPRYPPLALCSLTFLQVRLAILDCLYFRTFLPSNFDYLIFFCAVFKVLC